MTTKSPALIDAEQAAMMCGGVSVSVGASTPDQMPSAARAIGVRISADRHRVTVLLSRATAQGVLADLEKTRLIAVVFSEMATHRTFQLKGRDAEIKAPAAGDKKIAESYAEAFITNLEKIGFARERLRNLIATAPEDIVSVTFTPVEAYSQTPGPSAGAALQAGA